MNYRMLDFSSSLYLDFQHPSDALPPWTQLTTGKPLQLFQPPIVQSLNHRIASLTGSESAIIGKSTLHIYWDLLIWLKSKRITIYCDEYAYPTSALMINSILNHNKNISIIPHHDTMSLSKLLNHHLYRTPILFADGYSPLSGQIFPLNTFLPIIKKYNGLLILDDTQNFGIYGKRTNTRTSLYGINGGGIKQWHNINSPHILLISSLAKAFGVPISMLCGSKKMVNDISNNRFCSIHCSPISNDLLLATKHALDKNSKQGNNLRWKLASRINYFLKYLGPIKNIKIKTNHPFQTFIFKSNTLSSQLISFLKKNNIIAVHHQHIGDSSAVSIILSTHHEYEHILYLCKLLNRFHKKIVSIDN